MNITYKRLEAGDGELLKKLLKVFAVAFDDAQAYQSAIPSDSYISELLSQQTFNALVALDGEEVVAGLVAYELEKFEQERREMYIYDLAVLETHRRKGIATGLIRELQRIAKERKAYVIYVQADKEDMPAIKLYESLGTQEDVYHFDILVE